MKISFSFWWMVPQTLRFLVVGLYNTAFGYALFACLFLWLGKSVHYLVIGVMSHLLSVLSAFTVHRFLVFNSSEPWVDSFVRFNLSQLVALVFGSATLFALVQYAAINPLIAQALVVSASVMLTYFLHRNFSFQSVAK